MWSELHVYANNIIDINKKVKIVFKINKINVIKLKPSQLYIEPAVKLIQIYNKSITVSAKTKHTSMTFLLCMDELSLL